MTKRFKEVEKLLWLQAHRTSKIYSLEVEDAFGEACVIFCEACNQWEENRGKFSTFLFRKLSNELINWGSREIRRKGNSLPDNLSINEPGYLSIEIMERIKSLSKEAQKVIDIMINSPKEVLDLTLPPKRARTQLRDYLIKDLGWKKIQYRKVYKELYNFYQVS